MKLINKSIFLLACFGVLSCNASNSEKNSSQDLIIQELKEKFKKQFDAYDADETINGIVQKTLKDCDITRPVVVLQSRNMSNAYTAAQPFIHPQEFMIIGTKGQTLDQITGTIYHEVGHVAHGDVLWKKKLLNSCRSWGAIGISVLAGLGAGLKFNKHIKKPLLSVTIGILAALTTFVSGAFAFKYKDSFKELRADAFAYKNLVKHGKLDIAIGVISDHLSQHEFGLRSLPSFVCGYPSNLQRAQMGLDVMQQEGINIAHLIKNLPEDLDQGLKEHFPGQIKQFFPELA